MNRLASNALKLIGNSSFFLVVSEAIANLLGVLLFFRHSWIDFQFFFTLKKFKKLILDNKHFPLFFTFYVLSQVLSSEAVTLYIKRFLTEHEVGIFFLANKLFVQTALIVSSSLSLAFNHHLIQDQGKRIEIYKKTLFFYALSLLVAILCSLPSYSNLVVIFFGSKWTDLSKTLNFFLFLSPVKIFVGFFAHIILLSGFTKFIACFKIIQFLILILVLQLGFLDLSQFLKIFVPFEVIFDSVFVAIGYWLIKRKRWT